MDKFLVALGTILVAFGIVKLSIYLVGKSKERKQ